MSVSAQATQQVAAILDGVTSKPDSGVPGMVFVSVDKKGQTLVNHASGNIGLDTQKPMTLDTVFWIASCTKMITGIAAMQLVEQGKLALDDAELVGKIAPELKQVKVLGDDLKLHERNKDITLRMLLNHTAGFGYTFFNQKLTQYGRPTGIDEFSGDVEDLLNAPLVNQPGETWEYGTNIDWAGIIIERASGLRLNDYFQKNIFEPLGLKSISMFPGEEMRSQLAHMNQHWVDGSFTETSHCYRRPITAITKDQQDRMAHSGGAGCFAKPAEYVQILSALVNDGVHAPTGHRLLQSSTVDEMFKNQVPQFPNFARQGIRTANRTLATDAPELYPQEGNPPQGWGLTFFLTLEKGATGRAENTAHWAGLANLFWWADRTKGVAGMIASQMLPFGDLNVMGSWFACEKAIYDHLQ